MLQFRKLTISDRDWAQPFIEAEDSRSADYNFGNIYMWDGAYRQHLAALEGRLLTKLRYEDMPFFAFPIGSASTTSIPSRSWPPSPARSCTASATSATALRRSTAGNSSA